MEEGCVIAATSAALLVNGSCKFTLHRAIINSALVTVKQGAMQLRSEFDTDHTACFQSLERSQQEHLLGLLLKSLVVVFHTCVKRWTKHDGYPCGLVAILLILSNCFYRTLALAYEEIKTYMVV